MLETSIQELESLVRALESHWERARQQWRDAVARRFDERYKNPLSGQTQTVLQHLIQLENLIQSARREIES